MKVLVLGAGGPAGVNTCRALAVNHEVIAADSVMEHLIWCEPWATEAVYMPSLDVDAVNAVGADVVIPQPDSATMWLADHAPKIDAATFLPDRRTVALCQDKFMAGLKWRETGLREDRIELIDSAEYLLAIRCPFWFRARRGAGAKGAILARSLDESINWYLFWRGRGVDEFVAEAYLPGRDLAWSSLWMNGELVTSFLRERLEYLYPGLTPEGLTGTPTRARIVHDKVANLLAMNSVLAVDSNPHGIFSVDLREDAEGVPRPTEINAGRGFTTFGQWALLARHNLMDMVVMFAKGLTLLEPEPFDCIPEGTELRRHIDCGSYVYHPIPA